VWLPDKGLSTVSVSAAPACNTAACRAAKPMTTNRAGRSAGKKTGVPILGIAIQ
jgi:hypothetical protein